MKITKDEFLEYEKVRQSGETNMLAIGEVLTYCKLLNRDKVIYIMKNYKDLAIIYL